MLSQSDLVNRYIKSCTTHLCDEVAIATCEQPLKERFHHTMYIPRYFLLLKCRILKFKCFFFFIFQRHFSVFALSFPGQDALATIYNSILSQHLAGNGFLPVVQKISATLVQVCVQFSLIHYFVATVKVRLQVVSLSLSLSVKVIVFGGCAFDGKNRSRTA